MQMMNEKVEKVECNLCGSADCTELPIGLAMDKEEINAFGLDTPSWVLCNRCSLLYQSPRLTQAMWKKYYEESFYREVQSGKEIEAGYISYSYVQLQKVEAWLQLHGIEMSAGYPKSYLDYGCGIGGTLKYLRDKGCQSVDGIEVDPFLIGEGKRIFDVDISKGFDDPRLSGKKFDLIFTHHCLEHVMDLNEFFDYSRKSLENNGYLVIVVPTYKHGTVRFDYGTSIAHNFILTHHTIGGYLKKHGLVYVDHCYRKIKRGYDNELWCLARKDQAVSVDSVTFDPEIVKAELFEIQHAMPRRIMLWAVPDFLIVNVWQRFWRLSATIAKKLLPRAAVSAIRRAKGSLASSAGGRK